MIISGVYAIKNKINGKMYIGSSGDIEKRWTNHKILLRNNNHFNIKLQRAWNKYGKENIEFVILERTVSDRNVLCDSEQKYMDLYKSYVPTIGYNIATEAYVITIPDGSFFREYNKTKRRPVYQYDLNGNFIKEWNSLTEAAHFFNKNTTSIHNVCRKKIKTAYGFVWRYKNDIKDINTKIPLSEIKNACIVSVLQYDLDGNFIKEWESMFSAGKELKISSGPICVACKNSKKSAYGFIWKYKKNDEIEKKIKAFERIRTWKPVLQYDLSGNFIKEWRSATDAAMFLKIPMRMIGRKCRGVGNGGGFNWKFKNK